MFCRKCGNQITDGSKFCPKCGELVSQPVAQAQPVATSTATQQTATSMPAAQPVTITGKYCGKCGTDVALGVKFCPKCGNPIPQTNAQDTTPAVNTATPTPVANVATSTAPVADASVSAKVATVTDTATSAESLETSIDTQASETQMQAPKAKRTIRIITPTGEITFATEESVFDGEYVLEVHRDDELLGSTKIDV